MKKKDLIFSLCVIIFFLPFFLSDEVFLAYKNFNSAHSYIMSAIKFAVLATLGEIIGLRIKTGKYNTPGFGILPRAMVWAFLGISINMAFVIFSWGAPEMLKSLGFAIPDGIIKSSIFETRSWYHLLASFSISASMNLFFAPVFMTFHKITDTHIFETNGSIKGFFSKKIDFGRILKEVNWKVQWDFVFSKTIPFFWIPAHTITFMMPPQYRILIAAALGIVLGVFMAIAAVKNKEK